MMISNGVLEIVLGFVTSFVITYVATPSIIRVAHQKQLFDKPNKRKVHASEIPNLGGLAIFAGCIISMTIWINFVHNEFQYFVTACIIILFIGLKDDILVIAPLTKMLGQAVAAFVLVIGGNVRITNLYGLFGIYDINFYLSIFLSFFIILMIVNSYNFIDGIDGLAASIGVLNAAIIGGLFFMINRIEYCILSVALIGSLIAFLRFNLSKGEQKIFMGDTGSLLLGTLIAVLAIRFSELNLADNNPYFIHSAPAVLFGILVIPLFDLTRVFYIRVVLKRAPSRPDNYHIHHMLIRLGLKHIQATFTLVGINSIFIIFVIVFRKNGILRLTLIIFLFGMILSYIPSFIYQRKRIKKKKNKQR